MTNKSYKSMMLISIIIISILFSCATTRQKQSESKDANFYNSRGVDYGEKGQYDQAIADYDKAIEIDPKFGKAYNNRGYAYGKKGDYDQAIANYNKAIEMDPEYGKAYGNRAIAYYFKKEYDKSWEDVRKAKNLGYQIPIKFLDDLRKASGRQN